MHYIVTVETPNTSFNQTKLWFLNHWSNRVQAKVFLLDNNLSQLIQILKEDSDSKIFFLPTWAFPNLGIPNPFRKIQKYELALYKCKHKKTDGAKVEEPFYLSGKSLKKILSLPELNEADDSSLNNLSYLEFQQVVRNYVKSLIQSQSKSIKPDKKPKPGKNKQKLSKKPSKQQKQSKSESSNQVYHPLTTAWNYQITNYWEDQPFRSSERDKIYIYHLDPNAMTGRKIDMEHILHRIKEGLYDWPLLNQLRFRNVEDYSSMFKYTGRNKLGCKEIAKSLGVHVPETYQVVKEINQIDWDRLPDSYVIKPTNLDGARKVYAVHNGINTITQQKIKKSEVEKDYKNYRSKQAEKEINQFLSKILKPKIIVEEFIPNVNGKYEIPIDYKCYVFRGRLEFILVIDGERDRRRFAFFDRSWRQIPNHRYSTNTDSLIKPVGRPKYLEKLIENAETLAHAFRQELAGFWEGDFLRIDFYVNDTDVYFGEIAIFPNGARGKNVSSAGKRIFGKYWLGPVP